jgi:dTDP-4-dehydrorhamnose reductase
MKILVTGANGQLGTAVAGVFSDADVVAVDRDRLDITDRSAVEAFIARERPDTIVNCAAYNNVEKAGDEIASAFALNAFGPQFLAAAAAAIGARFVHVSTDYVFDGTKGDYVETDAPNPVNVYGVSKLAGEYLALAMCPQTYIVRTSWLFGPSSGGTRNFVTAMLAAAKTGDVRVVSDQVGSPSYAPDAARAIRAVLDRRAPYGRYHIANSGSCSRYEFAKAIFASAGVAAPVIPIRTAESGTLVRRPASSILTNTTFQPLGIPPLRDWREALDEYCGIMKGTL